MLKLSVEHQASVFTLEGEDQREEFKERGVLKSLPAVWGFGSDPGIPQVY